MGELPITSEPCKSLLGGSLIASSAGLQHLPAFHSPPVTFHKTTASSWGLLAATPHRLSLAAASLGAARGAYEDAVTFANSRVQFGAPVASYQAVQHKITDMAIKIENMANFTHKVAWMMDNNIPVRHEHAMCKLYVAQASFEVCDDAMQIMGGLGYMKASRVQRLWRDIRLMRLGGGTDEIMYNIAGPQLVKQFKSK